MRRWYIVPVVSDRQGEPAPKYIRGYGSIPVDAYVGHTVTYNGTDYYAVRVESTEATLDELASKSDVYGKQEYGISDSEVAQYLNDRLGLDRTFAEYEERFITEGSFT